MSVVRIHVVKKKKKKKFPGDFHEQYKELMYGTMPIWWTIHTWVKSWLSALPITTFSNTTNVVLQTCVGWVSHWPCELLPTTCDSAGFQSVYVYLSHLWFFGISLAQDLFNYISIPKGYFFILLAMIWCELRWQPEGPGWVSTTLPKRFSKTRR